jgi:hypothetical protein
MRGFFKLPMKVFEEICKIERLKESSWEFLSLVLITIDPFLPVCDSFDNVNFRELCQWVILMAARFL